MKNIKNFIAAMDLTNIINLLILVLLTAFATMVTSEVSSDDLDLEQFSELFSKRDAVEDVFSMLNDGNRQSCENLKPRSWCQIRRIFLSCKTERFRKNCKAMCNRKCRG
ncbi:uncharacterized protein [Porites lutea]|uniref:uncharacterized protein isoform X1 n=2 Tax=Porites lutea TaxID=51062 RepID=UPI003CC5FD0F